MREKERETERQLGIPGRKLDFRIIVNLKEEWVGRKWIPLNWLGRGTNGGLLLRKKLIFIFHKMLVFA